MEILKGNKNAYYRRTTYYLKAVSFKKLDAPPTFPLVKGFIFCTKCFHTFIGAMSQFAHLEKFSLNLSSLSFLIHINLLHH